MASDKSCAATARTTGAAIVSIIVSHSILQVGALAKLRFPWLRLSLVSSPRQLRHGAVDFRHSLVRFKVGNGITAKVGEAFDRDLYRYLPAGVLFLADRDELGAEAAVNHRSLVPT